MTVRVEHGDCRDVIRTLADCSIDSVVCDPPYALVSIVKRFGKPGSAPAQEGADGRYKRASAGFMGKQWDTGETAFDPAFWADVLRVMKPGAHLIAFGGTRSYHRLACAIEDAGFEIRDQLGWLYGSGFPKSHDVSKGIDKRRDWDALPKLQVAIRIARKAIGISQSEAARRCGLIGPGESLGGGGFMWFETGMRIPTRDQWPRLKAALGLGDEFDACFEAAEREVIGRHADGTAPGGFGEHRFAFNSRDITASATEAAKQWQGWGTALKPAWEPIVLARKPLGEKTIAANVLQHGTGALNIDGCRVATDDGLNGGTYTGDLRDPGPQRCLENRNRKRGIGEFVQPSGRWPANVILSYPEDEYLLRPNLTREQKVALYRWMSENA